MSMDYAEMKAIRNKIKELYAETSPDMPWVDHIGDALMAMGNAIFMRENFDATQHERNVKDQQIQDWRADE